MHMRAYAHARTRTSARININMEKPVNRMFWLFELMGLVLVGIVFLGVHICARLIPVSPEVASAIFSASAVGAGYCLAVNVPLGIIWRYVTANHPDYMTQFFTAASTLRFLGVMTVLGIMWLQLGRDAMPPYALVVFLYYIMLLGFHTVFFSHISNKLL